MIYPADFEEKSGFSQIREMILKCCVSTAGRNLASRLTAMTDSEPILQSLRQTGEMMTLLEEEGAPPAPEIPEIEPELQRLKVSGSIIGTDWLTPLYDLLIISKEWSHFFTTKAGGKFPYLSFQAGNLIPVSHLSDALARIIDEAGNIRDNASAELAKIRKSIKALHSRIEKQVNEALKTAIAKGWVAQGTEMTIRDGRQVIPVPAAHKRKIEGYVIDASSTGQTFFVEPAVSIELHNQLAELSNDEHREIRRILLAFTDLLRPDLDGLLANIDILAHFDFIRGRALVAKEYNGKIPALTPEPLIEWKNAVHPLLLLHHRKESKPVVAQDISLDRQKRILVISGPNAGGKSVALKTVILLQYMLQCGMPIPVDAESRSGIFNEFFLDIGDPQSMEDDLSTYSAHLLHLRKLLSFAGSNTLFCIDEFGSGTDPQLGGAIAEAVLEELARRKAIGVVTTHYSNLKSMAGRVEGILNGAMRFDPEKMKPAYELITGQPGSSFTFEVATSAGFSSEILERARELAGRKQVDWEAQLQHLEGREKELEEQERSLSALDNLLAGLVEEYQLKKSVLEQEKNKIIEAARQEASQMLQNTNRLIEKTIREIREAQAEKEKTRAARARIESAKKQFAGKTSEGKESEKKRRTKKPQKEALPAEPSQKVTENKQESTPPGTGDWVEVAGSGFQGEILGIQDKTAVVINGQIKMQVPVHKLRRIQRPKKQLTPYRTTRTTSAGEHLRKKAASFVLQLDVRGMRGEEALAKVQSYIEEAILLNVSEVKILHGKGYGILRQLIRDYLRTVPEIKSFSDEHIERGGHGITIVIFK
ncbi:MAG: endonuclease MutS2 [Bacteroidales bacterium]